MNLLILGYLSFCVATSLTENSEWNTRFPEIPDRYVDFDNCTRCDVKRESSCFCHEYVDLYKCVICCSNIPCCVCEECTTCWYEQRQLIIMTEIGISMLFGIGIVGLLIVYYKICNRTRQQHTRRRRRRIVLHEELTTYPSIIEDLRERPPSYNEVVRNAPSIHTSFSNNAPPLYTFSSYNGTFMQEAPPSYPGTPKPQEKIQDCNEPPSSSAVAQHI